MGATAPSSPLDCSACWHLLLTLHPSMRMCACLSQSAGRRLTGKRVCPAHRAWSAQCRDLHLESGARGPLWQWRTVAAGCLVTGCTATATSCSACWHSPCRVMATQRTGLRPWADAERQRTQGRTALQHSTRAAQCLTKPAGARQQHPLTCHILVLIFVVGELSLRPAAEDGC